MAKGQGDLAQPRGWRIFTAKDKLSRPLQQLKCSHWHYRGKGTRHASAAPCTTRPSVMARAHGMVSEAS